MSVYRETRLFCDGERHRCHQEFRPSPELGYPPPHVVRREAKKAGWTYVRYPGNSRSLDKDYCPQHKPTPAPTTPEGGQDG